MESLKGALRKTGILLITVAVHSGARETKFKTIASDGTVKIDVAAAPEDGKANEALVKFFAEEFDVPQSHIEIVSGQLGRRKRVRITQ